MVRRIKKVTKNRITRKRKRIIVVGTEGLNKTEILYLQEIEKKQEKYHFLFAQGNETDPVKIVRNTINKAKNEEISYKQGDMAISIFDLDLDPAKEIQLESAKLVASKKNIKLITSNPCFEVWYLEHFGFTSKPFTSSNEVVRDLMKKYPSYQKNRCDIDIFYPLTKDAIKNCKQLIEHHRRNGRENEFSNPITNIFEIVEVLTNKSDT